MSTLWMGNLEPYMDEKFIIRGFATMGETVMNVRIIRHKMTGGALGYCFVEMTDEATAERCLRKINGKPLPGANPPTRFKLNRATFGKTDTGPMFSLFVGDLTPEVDDGMLYEFFYNRYPQCRGGKVVLDHLGNSKGCGFVQFPDERLQKKALDECQGAVGLGGKALRLSLAANNLKNKQPTAPATGTDTKTWNSTAYSQSYDPYSTYGYGYPGYPASWGYDQNSFGYYPGFDYSQYAMMQEGEMAVEEAAIPEDDGTEDPNPPFDVEQTNLAFMHSSEELFDSFSDTHWNTPADFQAEQDYVLSLVPDPITA